MENNFKDSSDNVKIKNSIDRLCQAIGGTNLPTNTENDDELLKYSLCKTLIDFNNEFRNYNMTTSRLITATWAIVIVSILSLIATIVIDIVK